MQNWTENSFEIKQNPDCSKSARINLPTVKAEWWIIQLRAVIFERIRNVQIQALQTVFISLLLLSTVFMHFSYLIQTLPTSRLQWRNARFSNMLFDIKSCYWKSLCKMSSALCLLEHFSFTEQWTNFLTNRIAGKLINIKKIKLCCNEPCYKEVEV